MTGEMRDLDIAEIIIGTRREIDQSIVVGLAESIEKIGLRTPITVSHRDGKYTLVAGMHRIEAFKKLNREQIPCEIVVMTDAEARMWEIAENLHRAELTKLERAEHIEEWRKLCVSRGNREDRFDTIGRHNPRHDGERITAKELGIDRRTVMRAKIIAKISSDAKEAVRNTGMADNQAKLLMIAKEPAERQVSKVVELAGKSCEPEWRVQFERLWVKGTKEDRMWAMFRIDQRERVA